MEFLGAITMSCGSTPLERDRWRMLCASHPNLAPVPSISRRNPFKPAVMMELRVPNDTVRVVVSGVEVGRMEWGMNDSSSINVWGTNRSVISVARQIAFSLSAIFVELDVVTLFRGLCVLADTVVDSTAFSAAAQSLGWSVKNNEYAPDGNVVLDVGPPFILHPVVAVFAERSIAGIPLQILVDDNDAGSPFYVKTWPEFDAAFERVRMEIEGSSGPATVSGVYESEFVAGVFHYAVWPRREWSIVLVQHDEGDGHYGHGPTLDLRLLPGTPDGNWPEFPLETDLIF